MRYRTAFAAAIACIGIIVEWTALRPTPPQVDITNQAEIGPRFCELLIIREQRPLTVDEEQELWELRMRAKEQIREYHRISQAHDWQ